MLKVLICAVVLVLTNLSSQAQTRTGGAAKEIVQRQIASDLYFRYDEHLVQFSFSNH